MGDVDELLAAAAKGSLAQVKKLLSKGADVNSRGEYERTALMMSAGTGSSMDVLEFLLDRPQLLDVLRNVVAAWGRLRRRIGIRLQPRRAPQQTNHQEHDQCKAAGDHGMEATM